MNAEVFKLIPACLYNTQTEESVKRVPNSKRFRCVGLGIRFDWLAIKSNDNRVENFPSLEMGKTAAYDVKCDVTGLKKPAQFSVPLFHAL